MTTVAIVVRCEDCGRVYHVPADGEIKEITCSCGRAVPIPSVEERAQPRRPLPKAPPPPGQAPAAPPAEAEVAEIERVEDPAEERSRRRFRMAIWGAVLAGGVLAGLAGLAGDLGSPLWSVRLPGVPPWAWFVAPAAGIGLLWFIAPGRRPGGLAAVAALAAVTLASLGLLLLLHRLTFAWRPIVRHVFGGLTWAAVWPLIGALSAAATVGIASWFRRLIPEPEPGTAPSVRVRLTAAITGAAAAEAAWGGARLLPGLSMPGLENWTDPTALAGMAVLAAIIGGALAVASLDFGIQHGAGRLPLTGALCGVIAGAIVEPLLGLRGVPMLIALVALPVAGGLSGMAAGLAVAAGGRARRVALVGLMMAAVGVVVAGTIYYPSPEAIRTRMLIAKATEPNAEGEDALRQLREVDDPSTIRTLAAGIQHDNDEVSQTCAWALSRMNDRRAVTALLKVIDDEDSRVRQAAIRAAVTTDDERAVRPLRSMLTGEDERLARDGAWGLAGLGDAGLTALLEVARSSDPQHRRRALSGLARLVEDQPRAREALLAALKDTDPSVRSSAVSSLDDIGGDEAFARLSEMMADPSPEVQRSAIRTLARMEDPRAVETLSRALHSGDESLVSSAADGLGRIGTPEAVALLKQAAQTGDEMLVRHAANGLGYAGTPEAVAVLRDLLVAEVTTNQYSSMVSNAILNKDNLDPTPLVPLIAHENEQVRQRISSLLPILLEGRAELLYPYLDHQRPETRAIAAYILGARDVNGEAARVIPLLADPDEQVRNAAHQSLQMMGKRAVPELAEALTDENADLAVEAALALSLIKDASAVPPLIEALSAGRPRVAAAAADALGEIGDRSAVEPLMAAFEAGDSEVRPAVARALGKLGATQYAEDFIKMLETGDVPSRAAAAAALGALKSAVGVEPLVDALSDSSAEVRAAAADALGAIGKPAVEPLVKLVDSQDQWVRQGARDALRRIDDPEAKRALEDAEPEEMPWGVPPPPPGP